MNAHTHSTPGFEFTDVIDASLAALARNVAAAKDIPIDSSGCEYIAQLVLGVMRGSGCALIDQGDLKATSTAATAIIRVLEHVGAETYRHRAPAAEAMPHVEGRKPC